MWRQACSQLSLWFLLSELELCIHTRYQASVALEGRSKAGRLIVLCVGRDAENHMTDELSLIVSRLPTLRMAYTWLVRHQEQRIGDGMSRTSLNKLHTGIKCWRQDVLVFLFLSQTKFLTVCHNMDNMTSNSHEHPRNWVHGTDSQSNMRSYVLVWWSEVVQTVEDWQQILLYYFLNTLHSCTVLYFNPNGLSSTSLSTYLIGSDLVKS